MKIVRDIAATAFKVNDPRPRIYGRSKTWRDTKTKMEADLARGIPVGHHYEPHLFPIADYPVVLVVDEVPDDPDKVDIATKRRATRITVRPGIPVGLPDLARSAAASLAVNPKKAFGDRKPAVHLVPPALVLETAPNMADGAEKYGPFNWRSKPVNVTTYVGAILRHAMALLDGEDVDPESKRGAGHLGAIGANVAIIADARDHGTLVDDRVRGPAGKTIRRTTGTGPENGERGPAEGVEPARRVVVSPAEKSGS